MDIEFLIADSSGDVAYVPVLEEGIEWTTERTGSPGKLTFTVVRDSTIQFEEGNAVRLKVDGENIFYGFVFKKKRDKDQLIEVTAYDQLRYLQNSDTYVYEDKTAAEFIQMIADDFYLNVGELEDTEYVIGSRVEEDSTLFDMIQNALDLTLTNTGNLFVLYDDFGSLTLKNITNMYVGSDDEGYLMICESSAEDYEYTSSIDSETYNKIKLTYDNEDTGTREVYVAQDSEHINDWGVLQYFETLDENENGDSKADALLELYNQKTRNLKITNAIGDTRVRAGSMVIVSLDLGDITVQNFMLVEKCVHKFKLDEHFMDLTLRGGEFVVS